MGPHSCRWASSLSAESRNAFPDFPLLASVVFARPLTCGSTSRQERRWSRSEPERWLIRDSPNASSAISNDMAELVLALDLASADAAMKLLDRLPGLRWVKVGSVLMTREGAPLIQALTSRGLRVFLDLKWHDIPNTVAGAVSAAGQLGVSLATVHTLGGRKMMEAAARAAAGQVRLVGVTVLTSHDDSSYSDAIGRPETSTPVEVIRLAASAMDAGLDGVVCSPLEVVSVRTRLGSSAIIVVPGIRRAEDALGDQKRTATPAAVVAAGATHLVVGRPILDAPDPAHAFQSLSDLMV